MNHDGTKEGFALDALARLAGELTIPVIASGGAGEKAHFLDGVHFAGGPTPPWPRACSTSAKSASPS